jgi:hypothetical protein
MARTFTITCAAGTIRLAGQARGECSFTITNTATTAVKAHPVVVALDSRAGTWFAVAGEPVREIASGQTVQVTVVINPSGAPPGRYGFRLDVLPGEGGERSTGPEACVELTSEAAPLPPGHEPFPWWWLVLVGALLAVIGVVLWLVLGRDGAATDSMAADTNPTESEQPAITRPEDLAVEELTERWLAAFRKRSAKALATLTDAPAIIDGKLAADTRAVLELYTALLDQERSTTRAPLRSTTSGKPMTARVRDIRSRLPASAKDLALADDDHVVGVTVTESDQKFVLLIRQGPPLRIAGVTR